MTTDLDTWLSDLSTPNYLWYAKRLSGNDTLANGTHQAGPYIPKDVLFRIFPELNNSAEKNPDTTFRLSVDSHGDERMIRAIWYNNRLFGGTRNETRITGFGGIESPLLDPENTGALAVFAFRMDGEHEDVICRVWVCRNSTEEDLVESHLGVIEPGKWLLHSFAGKPSIERNEDDKATRQNCWLEEKDFPSEWLQKFPSGIEIIRKTIELRPEFSRDIPDKRLIKRRECEYQLFKSLEQAVEFPRIQGPFKSIDLFLDIAQSILQRRKSRAGRSLELHLKEIFQEESLVENRTFSHQPVSELNKRPDFIFPSATDYHDPGFPDEKLRMLAVKTTCKDRWRQILNEADRIGTKHLLTVQQGISVKQFREMQEAHVQLVVPSGLIGKFHEDIRSEIMTLGGFLDEMKILAS